MDRQPVIPGLEYLEEKNEITPEWLHRYIIQLSSEIDEKKQQLELAAEVLESHFGMSVEETLGGTTYN